VWEASLTGPHNYRRQQYVGFDGGREPEFAAEPSPSPHERALADAGNEIQMQAIALSNWNPRSAARLTC
jgi:hypothetical protein